MSATLSSYAVGEAKRELSFPEVLYSLGVCLVTLKPPVKDSCSFAHFRTAVACREKELSGSCGEFVLPVWSSAGPAAMIGVSSVLRTTCLDGGIEDGSGKRYCFISITRAACKCVRSESRASVKANDSCEDSEEERSPLSLAGCTAGNFGRP